MGPGAVTGRATGASLLSGKVRPGGELFMTVGRRVARLETRMLQRETRFLLPCAPPQPGQTAAGTCATAGQPGYR